MNDRKKFVKKEDRRLRAVVGIYLLGLACCIAGPAAVLAGLAGLQAWFGGLHPYLVASAILLAAISFLAWRARQGCRNNSEPRQIDRGAQVDNHQ